MRTQRIAPRLGLVLGALLLSSSLHAAITKTELAGNTLTQYPFFEYVRAFNVDQPVRIAIDPTRFPSITGLTCDIYIVNHKSPSDWTANPSLADVTPGGKQTQMFSGVNIQGNTIQITGPNELNANAGLGLGVAYDVVIDVNQNGSLDGNDFIDGLGGEAGFYMVSDTTVAGPAAVTEVIYNLDPVAAAASGVDSDMLGEDLFYPTNIAAMGKLPLIMVGHGTGHDYTWYGHIGRHLASYGYIVVSHQNDCFDGSEAASLTTLGHTNAFLDQAEAGVIAGGALQGHIDSHRIVWIGHSRGAEGVAIAYDKLFDGVATPSHYTRQDIRLIDSMLPTDWFGVNLANPHDANYHLWTAAGDTDVDGSAGCDLCQTFHLLDRATGFRQSSSVQGTGHGWFHDNEPAGSWFTGPCALDEAKTHQILLGYQLPLVKHYVEGNIPALDFLTRQYESFRPIGVPAADPCVVVTNEYRNGASAGNFVIDDYQTNTGTNLSSSGAMVTFDVEHVSEGLLDDNNGDFVWSDTDPFNGATEGGAADSTRGVVFDWTDADHFYEWQVPAGANDFSKFRFLSFRGAQGTQHPNTVATLGDLTFSVTVRDGANVTSTINIGAYGGGLEEPYQRDGGWYNEMETIRIRTADFLNNASGLNLANITAVRLNVGPSFGSSRGRVVLDDLMLTNDLAPLTLRILEPTTAHHAFAGTSVAGSNVLVRLIAGGGLDLSQANLTVTVDGVNLMPAQIPTPATQVGGETWLVINPGPKANGCYDLTVTLTMPDGISATETQSLCWADDEARTFDRVLAIDQTNSMNYDGHTGVHDTAKMDAARAAAKFFVDLSNAQDQIGVISFQRRDENDNGTVVDPDELSEPVFTLVPAGEGMTDQRPAARTAITGIAPDTTPGFAGPETSIGAGLVEARTMLNTHGVMGHEQHIVLVTDGLENYPPFWTAPGPGGPLRSDFDAGTIRVDTVGVGGDADDAILQDIANVTDGEYRNLNEGSGSYFLLSRLADFYKTVDEDVRGEQRFFYAEGFPSEGITLADRRLRVGHFDVEPALDWMTVAFHANIDNAATVRLFEPGSTTALAAAPPAITVRTDPKHSVYRIGLPKPGRWTYVVDPHDTTAEFMAIASAPTILTARVGPNQLERRPSADYSMPLRVWIADRQSVRNATVTGYVRRPDGVKDTVTLLDAGVSLDGRANDGVYGLQYLATIPGAYFVHLKASGTSNTGEPFERYLSTAFLLPGAPHRPIQPGEDGRPPQGFGDGHCGCESETRYSLAYYGGVTFPHGTFNTIADPSWSLGIRPALHFNALGGTGSLGLYLGRDNFANASSGPDFHLTHLSPELEFAPWRRFCPTPSFHAGIGAYRTETGQTKFGYNLGLGFAVCLRARLSFLTRYDYLSVNAIDRNYSTIQAGLRFSF